MVALKTCQEMHPFDVVSGLLALLFAGTYVGPASSSCMHTPQRSRFTAQKTCWKEAPDKHPDFRRAGGWLLQQKGEAVLYEGGGVFV